MLSQRVEALGRSAEEAWRHHGRSAAAIADMAAKANASSITTAGSIELVRKNVRSLAHRSLSCVTAAGPGR